MEPVHMAASGDSYCGLYCGACSILRHGETGREDAFVACLGRVPGSAIACGGCKSTDLYAGCRLCRIRECARARGVAHCAGCVEYPCRAYAAWSSLARLLPHVRDAAANNAAMRKVGADEWLAAQQRRWTCPRCGTPFSWYAAKCAECGRDLGAHALTGLRRLVCRVALPLIYRRAKRRST